MYLRIQADQERGTYSCIQENSDTVVWAVLTVIYRLIVFYTPCVPALGTYLLTHYVLPPTNILRKPYTIVVLYVMEFPSRPTHKLAPDRPSYQD